MMMNLRHGLVTQEPFVIGECHDRRGHPVSLCIGGDLHMVVAPDSNTGEGRAKVYSHYCRPAGHDFVKERKKEGERKKTTQ